MKWLYQKPARWRMAALKENFFIRKSGVGFISKRERVLKENLIQEFNKRQEMY